MVSAVIYLSLLTSFALSDLTRTLLSHVRSCSDFSRFFSHTRLPDSKTTDISCLQCVCYSLYSVSDLRSFRVSYSNTELDPSSVGVLRDNCFTVISEVTPGHIAHVGLSLSRWPIWSPSYTDPPGFCFSLTALRLVAKKYRF